MSKNTKRFSDSEKNNQSNGNKVSQISSYLKAKYDFRYNEVTKETEYKPKNLEDYSPIDEMAIADLRLDLSEQGYTAFKGLLDDLLKSSRFPQRFNPFKAYFETLPEWDGKNDFISELTDHVRLEDEGQREWFRLMFRKHLMRTVACALRKLSFNKHCLVFLGKQNDGKTSFIRFLAPVELKDYYKENPPLDHKDSITALGDNLIINLDELNDLNKTDANKIKSLLSQADTKVRRHYAVKDSVQVRYASFFGSTNEREFLNDPTGSVRWIVFEIDGIQHDYGGERGYSKRVSIDNIWAQAYTMVMEGEAFDLTASEVNRVEEINQKYQRSTSEMDYVEKFIKPSEKGVPHTFAVTPTMILDAIHAVTKTTSKLNIVQLGKALVKHKCKKVSIRLIPDSNPVNRYLITSDNPDFLNFLAAHADYITT
ncbi:virulence-associated E family protein [Telluribacter sp. SYSU D00476]|uniref:virulence-associated E family protein n=1 Tax=Telluribacter sp. SYSU D00476 TaxID=2811430 RepID=UPI001FF4E357|nr:virulence-associated E family protein [Telluribacter sp. SYSU D00476]